MYNITITQTTEAYKATAALAPDLIYSASGPTPFDALAGLASTIKQKYDSLRYVDMDLLTPAGESARSATQEFIEGVSK